MGTNEINGQYSIFGADKEAGSCGYRFDRYIGQKVNDHNGEHIIKEIWPYYTLFEDGMVGTPFDLSPVDYEERTAYLRNELRVEIQLEKKEKDLSFKSIHMENIRKIIKAMKEEEAKNNEHKSKPHY